MASEIMNSDVLDKINYVMERVVILEGVDQVLQHIVKTAVNLTRSNASVLRVFDTASGKLEIKASLGLSDNFLMQPSLALGDSALGLVALDGTVFTTPDITALTDGVHGEKTAAEGLRACLSVPLISSQSSIGCLTVYRKSEEPFSEADIAIMRIFAAQSVETIERTRYMEELRKQATFDHLTSLYNRNFLMKKMEEELKRASRHNLVFSVILLDIDNFKAFNDGNGHLFGDKLLADVAGIMKATVRKNDFVSRYGGEEFVIISPETDKIGGVSIAEKILAVVNSTAFMGSKGELRGVGFSAGVATFPEDGDTFDSLIGKADQAMYAAKQEGKNRVKTYGGEQL